MSAFLLRRIIQSIPTLFGITLISFALMIAAPGDPITRFAFNPQMDAEDLERMRRQLGLDQPILTQYVYWMVGNDWAQVDSNGDGEADSYGERRGLLRGDLGTSFIQNRPVLEMIAERIPATLRLSIPALFTGYLVGITLGMLAAVYQGSIFDSAVRFLSVLGIAVPSFWLGLILIIIFSVQLQLLPIGGMRDLSRTDSSFDAWEYVRFMILPVTVLALGIIATVTRFMRTSVLEVIEQDYVRTARSKGLSDWRVFNWHVARNALIPIATLFGPALAGLFSGAVIIEQVFAWPGMGRLAITALLQRDFPVVMGTVLIGAVLYIIGLLISDVLYAVLDPRIRLS